MKITKEERNEAKMHRCYMTRSYLWLFPANMAPCFLQVTRGGGTPLTIHSSTAGLLMCTDTAWEPSLIVGATEGTDDKYIVFNSFVAGS